MLRIKAPLCAHRPRPGVAIKRAAVAQMATERVACRRHGIVAARAAMTTAHHQRLQQPIGAGSRLILCLGDNERGGGGRRHGHQHHRGEPHLLASSDLKSANARG